jgi:hypothetical protein
MLLILKNQPKKKSVVLELTGTFINSGLSLQIRASGSEYFHPNLPFVGIPVQHP